VLRQLGTGFGIGQTIEEIKIIEIKTPFVKISYSTAIKIHVACFHSVNYLEMVIIIINKIQ